MKTAQIKYFDQHSGASSTQKLGQNKQQRKKHTNTLTEAKREGGEREKEREAYRKIMTERDCKFKEGERQREGRGKKSERVKERGRE